MISARHAARAAIVAAVALVACSDPVVGPIDLLDYSRARARWVQTRPIDYSYVTSTACFCPPEVNQPARVEVRGDTVSAVRTLDGALVPRDRWYGRTTIDSLFVRVLAASREPYAERVRITYDATYGYPTRLEVIPQQNIADGGYTTVASDLRPLPVP